MKNGNADLLKKIEDFLSSFSYSEEVKTLRDLLDNIKQTKLNILVVGATGVGKSSTVNAVFKIQGVSENKDVAEIGKSAKPQTQEITAYELKNTIIWDTPGLGDSSENDRLFSKMIMDKLKEKNDKGEAVIDLVLCLLDASSRDLGTTYTLLTNHIIPFFKSSEVNDTDRIIIALNKIDKINCDGEWDYENNRPDDELMETIDMNKKELEDRLYSETGIKFDLLYFTAGRENIKKPEKTVQPYNISKLLYFMVNKLKDKKKRVVISRDVNQKKENYKNDDGRLDYNRSTNEAVEESLFDIIWSGAKKAAEVVFSPSNIISAVKAGFGWVLSKFSL
ncbi:hypothetical protein A6B43_04790 [Vespertiliibacter pulmonis]|uniref:G domain-containing protein n=1 Tax=Vespertiliibacter pulmonis TaxID=1443036 RepID=A0A3N4WE66_9PAST|nr:GTPase [Vespertiliibacter pulmonis]QLB20891.1 hypothetical protein A6B43_04790 [Vespertiliibacter pulmonis]RPE83544.1 hypothetical protein EDC46_1237 [Vespertiliibacter pulmonis]